MSAIEVASTEDILRYARGALRAADALDVTPIPMDEVEAAIGLLPAEHLFAAGAESHPRFARLLAKMKSRVLGLFAFGDRRIYLDPELPLHRRRFTHGHELGHHALPWHEQAYFVDDATTLAPETRTVMEQEANAFAADLLFGAGRFTEMADARTIEVATPLELSKMFQASAHAALRQYVARSNRSLGLLVLGKIPERRDGQTYLRVFDGQCVESESFRDRYGAITSMFPQLIETARAPYAAAALGAQYGIGEDEFEIFAPTARGDVRFATQRFTGRLHFLLIWHRPRLGRPRQLHVVRHGG